MIKSRARQAVKLMKHQVKSLEHDAKTPLVFDMSDPGTGKTAVRIVGFAERRRKGGGCLLVSAPKSLLRLAWFNDFAKFAPDMKVSVCDAANREAGFAADADVYVVNHDGIKALAGKKPSYFQKFEELDVDEVTAYKHHTSQRSRSMCKVAHMRIATKPVFKKKAVMTATPTSNGVCDIWHPVFLLDGGKRLGPSFYAFRQSVCEATQVGHNKNAINWTDKEGAEEAVFNLINDIAIRHKFQDCVDIPKTHLYTVDFELSTKHRKSYEIMAGAQLLLLQDPASRVGRVTAKLTSQPPPKLTAVNAAAVVNKLLQIASGAVYDNDGKAHILDTARYEAIMDMAEVRKQPLIFFFWKHQRDYFAAEADRRDMRYCVLDGDANDSERLAMVSAYQRGEYDLMFAHPKSAAHGLTLTAGTSTIWSGPTADLEWFKQGNQRQARIGQTDKTEVVTMVAKDTIEERIYHEILMPKDGRMKSLLDLFTPQVLEPV